MLNADTENKFIHSSKNLSGEARDEPGIKAGHKRMITRRRKSESNDNDDDDDHSSAGFDMCRL